MTTPDPRRTIDAVRQVRSVWPNAVMRHRTRIDGKAEFNVHMDNVESGAANATWIACGDTRKEAWWNAVPKALAKALTL